MSRATRSASDEIEFLEPNDAAFGGAGGADFVGFDGPAADVFDDDGPRSKWLPAVASVVVLGLLGAGVIAAAPWSGGATATPPTTTTPATTTTAVAPTTTILDVLAAGPPGYVLDDPGPFRMQGAWTSGAGSRPASAYADDRFDLWTTPGASRTDGRWLAVSFQHARGSSEETWPNGVRLMLDSGNAVLAVSDDGVSRMSFAASDGTPFEIGGFGFELPDLLAVAAEVRSGADGNTIYYGSLIDGVLAGLAPFVSQLVPYGGVQSYNLLAQPESGVYYSSPDYSSSLELHVSRPTDLDDAVFQFLMQPVTGLTAKDAATLTALCSGQPCRTPVHLGQDPASPGWLLASWTDERGAITVSGYNVPVSTLIGLLPQVRLTERDEWADLVQRTNEGKIGNQVATNAPQQAPTQIGQHEAGSDAPFWTAEMMAEDRGTSIYVNANNTGWGGFLTDVGVAPAVHRYAAPSISFVVGTAQFPSVARIMRVTLQGLPPVEVPMVRVGDSAIYAAAYAYSELLPETLEFLDANGTLVTE